MKNPWINGWRLFWLIAVPMSAAMVWEASGVDLSRPQDVSHMIGYSVRWSVPFICLVMAASALVTLSPNTYSRWLLRNRKFIGLCFAVAMAWQGLFIAVMSTVYNDYYYESIYYFRDELEGTTGYIFLTAMVVTSFQAGRRMLSATQWKLLHRTGTYYLWAYPFSVYWWNLYYYENPEALDYAFYAACFTACALRVAAWGRKRHKGNLQAEVVVPVLNRVLGGAIVGAGLIAAVTGLRWQDPVTTFLTTPAWSANLELWLPFWPFEPFLPLFCLGLGAMLMTSPGSASAQSLVAER